MDLLSLLGDQISAIEINTVDGPPIVLSQPFAPQPPSPGGGIEETEKPQIIIRFADGSQPLVINPWGPPPPTTWSRNVTLAEVGVAIIIPLALYGGWHLYQKNKARKAGRKQLSGCRRQ